METRSTFGRTDSALTGIARYLIDELAREGANHSFWDSYWRLAPWLSADEATRITREARALPRPAVHEASGRRVMRCGLIFGGLAA